MDIKMTLQNVSNSGALRKALTFTSFQLDPSEWVKAIQMTCIIACT